MKDCLIKKKSHLVYISRLDDRMVEKIRKDVLLDKARFLYVGRMSNEKGIFEFLKMFNQIKFDADIFDCWEFGKSKFFK